MLREIINPKSNQIVITLPPELVNQELELLIFPTKKNKKYDTKKLMGCVFKNAETTGAFPFSRLCRRHWIMRVCHLFQAVPTPCFIK
jgi:hypothetical protein